ncbi:MAG: Asp-tRNA(Asn)/Glu-tRNA(Gln) amidotransferase subunit GatA [bacterium]|nr:Asp-tRNA(Asn)/Glu-tRNA(Gln) amidotransferase subunit GatA [Planctomycetota bacterium]HIL52253.1 Asp-tRNA(Asn)/Glu-tRNA(Gln) amidotransferase subunit GatA [Planctomycetota bacterium]
MSDWLELDAVAWRARATQGGAALCAGVDASLAAIASLDGQVQAFAVNLADSARERARALAQRLDAGEIPGPLFGVPIALKANMCLEGVETHCGSKLLKGYAPPYSATFVQRVIDAGAIPVGMTHMDEFAMGSSSENSAYETPRNPWDLSRTPGGSSGGSAAAVASCMVPLALGSDTGGSVRQPASFCGLFGLKPSYGRVSRYGLVAFGSSLDAVSPLARSVRDIEQLLFVISGADPRDATCCDLPALEPGSGDPPEATSLRIGVPAEYFGAGIEQGVRETALAALAELKKLGAELVPVDLPHTSYAIPTYYVVATAEASSNLARFDGVAFGQRASGDGSLQGMFAATREAGFGEEVKRRVLLGTYVLSAGYHDKWYGRAQRVRTLLRQDFERAFEKVDLIAGPTSPTTAFRLGERNSDPLAMYQADACTVPTSLAGLPAMSLPVGFTAAADGTQLPVGLQLIAPALEEARILRLAALLERATGAGSQRPPLAAGEFS